MEYLITIIFFFALLASGLTVIGAIAIITRSTVSKVADRERNLDILMLLVMIAMADIFWAIFFYLL